MRIYTESFTFPSVSGSTDLSGAGYVCVAEETGRSAKSPTCIRTRKLFPSLGVAWSSPCPP